MAEIIPNVTCLGAAIRFNHKRLNDHIGGKWYNRGMKQLLMVLILASAGLMATEQETAAALGERFQKTRAPADKLAWYQALEREGHDFSKRVRTPVDARGVYKLNRASRLACLVFRKTDRVGDSWDEDLGPDGTLHVEWTRKPNGGIDYSYSAPTNWDVFVSAYPGAVTRYGVKVMKARPRLGDPMPQTTLPDGWRVVPGEEYSGVNVREAYLTLERDGTNLPPPQVELSWPGVAVRTVYGASNVVVSATGARFIPTARKPPTSFSTPLPRQGSVSASLTHHLPGMQAGPHRTVPYPTNEIKTVANFVFALREAFLRLGFGEEKSIAHGNIWLGGFDSNFPNGHTDFPAHFHIIVNARDGSQVNHFYMRPEDGRVTWNCYQDMNNVMDVWDRVTEYKPGDEIPMYDGRGRVAFTVKMLPDGTGFDLVRPWRPHIRVCGTRPCDAVNVYEPNGSDWRLVKSFTITDDPVNGILSTHEGVIRYDPDTGRRRP